MILDAADLALLEIDIENLDPLGRDVAKMLIEHIRYLEERVQEKQQEWDDIRVRCNELEEELDELSE